MSFNRSCLRLLAFVWFVFASHATGQTTYFVDGDCGDDNWTGQSAECAAPDGPKRTIQAGIDAAVDGDTVVVSDGLYAGTGNKNLSFGGQAITLRSENGPASCVIDCEHDGRGFAFDQGETRSSVLDGFTVTNGYIHIDNGVSGGGIHVRSSSPTIMNCWILGNESEFNGGGMNVDSLSEPLISNCTIEGNRANYGGGIIFNQNVGSPVLIDCKIRNNLGETGGGLRCHGTPLITRCLVERNIAAGSGGGISADSIHDRSISRCIIRQNRSVRGGGVYAEGVGGVLTLENCLVYDNTAIYGGGGVACGRGGLIMNHCTLTGNVASHYGGGLWFQSPDAASYITNCILRDCDAPLGAQIAGTPLLSVSYCDVQGGFAGTDGVPSWGLGNLDVDPSFAFPGDPHLLPGSPCIDVATNDPPGGSPDSDFEGTPRVLDGDGNLSAVADMGAFEFDPSQPTIAVSSMALKFFVPEGDPDGQSQIWSIRNSSMAALSWEIVEDCPWLTAAPTTGETTGEVDDVVIHVDVDGLSHGKYECGLDVVSPDAVNSPRAIPVTLYVNADLRVPQDFATIQDAIDAAEQHDTVLIADGIYTGLGNKELDYHGKEITVRSENGPESCIINCEEDGRAFYFHNVEGRSSILRGLTITNGFDAVGGGILCEMSSPIIEDCIIANNNAFTENSGAGGGIATDDWAAPTIMGCTILNNSTRRDGGGIACLENSTATILDCTVSGNSAMDDGGGISLFGMPAIVSGCTVTSNYSASIGGGIYCGSSAAHLVSDCNIAKNWADSQGGGIYCGISSTVDGCTVVDNVSLSWGGGIRSKGGIVVDCFLSGNSASSGGGLSCESAAVCVNCTTSGNHAGYGGGGVHCTGGDPQFLHCRIQDNTSDYRGGGVSGNGTYKGCTIANNHAEDWGGGVHCESPSPLFFNCLIYGNSTDGFGGGLVSNDECIAVVANSILWGNAPGQISITATGYDPVVRYSDIQNGWAGDGNINADPLFENPLKGDFQFAAGSPCIDAGDNELLHPDLTEDVDGNPRLIDDPDTKDTGNGTPPIVDMGPYEFQAGGPVGIVDAASCLLHDEGGPNELELCIHLNDTDHIEPRRGGPKDLTFEASLDLQVATVLPENVQVACANEIPPTVLDVELQDGRFVQVALSSGLADQDCCRFSFDGMLGVNGQPVTGAYQVVSLHGDMNFSRSVTGSDALLVKPHFGEVVGVDLAHPKWDYDLSGGVTGADFALIKPRLGNVAADCP